MEKIGQKLIISCGAGHHFTDRKCFLNIFSEKCNGSFWLASKKLRLYSIENLWSYMKNAVSEKQNIQCWKRC